MARVRRVRRVNKAAAALSPPPNPMPRPLLRLILTLLLLFYAVRLQVYEAGTNCEEAERRW